MAAVRPWRRLRNLDVAAAVSLVVAVVLFQHRYLSASVLAAAPAMVYLLLRCAVSALAPRVRPAGSTPLLGALTPGMDPARRVRWLRWLLVMVALVYVMVGVSSTDAVDVIYAVMEGATTLIHGVAALRTHAARGDPWRHLPDPELCRCTRRWRSSRLCARCGTRSTAGSRSPSLAALVAAWAVFRTTAGARAARPVRAGRSRSRRRGCARPWPGSRSHRC